MIGTTRSTGSCSENASTAFTRQPRTRHIAAACAGSVSSIKSIAPLALVTALTRSMPASTCSLVPSKVSSMYALASGQGNFWPVKLSPSSTTLRSINSIAVGLALAFIILSTDDMPVCRSPNGTSAERDTSGLGTRRSMHLVITPSVPSEPTIRCFRLRPLASFTFLVPAVITRPSAVTTSSPRT